MEDSIDITPKGRAMVAFAAWHDKRWPRPSDSAPHHWRVSWRQSRMEKAEAWMVAWNARGSDDAVARPAAPGAIFRCF